jgi:microcystin degradation protein MlrC
LPILSFYLAIFWVAATRGAGRAPIVLADVWDNPGGGTPGDGTLILRALLERNLDRVAFASIWDPVVVGFCHAAGVGATLEIRLGGKCSALAGPPLDLVVRVISLHGDGWQSFRRSRVSLGRAAVVAIQGRDFRIIVHEHRTQTYEPNIFTNQGIALESASILVVKSTNHFRAGFEPIAAEIIYVDAGAPYPSDARTTKYRNLTRAIWPRVEDPHSLG